MAGTTIIERIRRTPVWVQVLVGNVLLSLLFWRVLVRHIGTHTLSGGYGDVGLFTWWLRWDAYAVSHGVNPLHTTYLQAPNGVSALWNTAVLGLGVPLTPITLMFGATASFNVAMIACPALSAWTATLWLRRHTRTGPAVLGGLMYAYSPIMLAHFAAHLQLCFLMFAPVIVMLIEDLIYRAPRPMWQTGVLLGVTISAQYFIGSEILLLLALATVPAILCVAASRPHEIRTRWRPAVIGSAIAVATALVILAYPLSQQLSPTYRIDYPIQGGRYNAALSDLVTPTQVLHFSNSAYEPGRLNVVENGAYLGWPLLVLLIGTVVLLRHRVSVRVAGVVALLAVVCELDPRTPRVFGHKWPLSPLGVLQHFTSLTADIVVARSAFIVVMATVYLVAVALDALITNYSAHRVRSGLALGLVAVAVISLWPGRPYATPRVPAAPAFFTSADLERVIPAGSTVMIAPMATVHDVQPQFWQVAAAMRFKQLGGYSVHRSAGGRASFFPRQPTLTVLFGIDGYAKPFGGPLTPDLLRQARAELAASGAQFFLVGPSRFGMTTQLRLAAQVLGRQADMSTGGVAIWTLTTRCGSEPNNGPVCPS